MRKFLLLSAGLVLLDQATKLAIAGFNLFGIQHTGMQLYESHQILGDFLRFTFVENPGMAFGLDFGMPVILGLFSIVASIFIIYLLRKSTTGPTSSTGFRVALAMILGGAVGNLIDRVFYGLFYGYGPLFYGKVVDFIDVDISMLGMGLDRFYIFNIADSAVSIGVVLLLIFYPSQTPSENEDDGETLHEESGAPDELATQMAPNTTESSGDAGDTDQATSDTPDTLGSAN